MDEPTETLEEWAAVARLLDADGWRDAERCAAGEVDYIEPHDDWCIDTDGCRALLAFRKGVVDNLDAGLREEIVNHDSPGGRWVWPRNARIEALQRLGLCARGRREPLTPLGTECARVLSQRGGRHA